MILTCQQTGTLTEEYQLIHYSLITNYWIGYWLLELWVIGYLGIGYWLLEMLVIG